MTQTRGSFRYRTFEVCEKFSGKATASAAELCRPGCNGEPRDWSSLERAMRTARPRSDPRARLRLEQRARPRSRAARLCSGPAASLQRCHRAARGVAERRCMRMHRLKVNPSRLAQRRGLVLAGGQTFAISRTIGRQHLRTIGAYPSGPRPHGGRTPWRCALVPRFPRCVVQHRSYYIAWLRVEAWPPKF